MSKQMGMSHLRVTPGRVNAHVAFKVAEQISEFGS